MVKRMTRAGWLRKSVQAWCHGKGIWGLSLFRIPLSYLGSWISCLVKQIPKPKLFTQSSHSMRMEKTRGRADQYQHSSLLWEVKTVTFSPKILMPLLHGQPVKNGEDNKSDLISILKYKAKSYVIYRSSVNLVLISPPYSLDGLLSTQGGSHAYSEPKILTGPLTSTLQMQINSVMPRHFSVRTRKYHYLTRF